MHYINGMLPRANPDFVFTSVFNIAGVVVGSEKLKLYLMTVFIYQNLKISLLT